MFFFAVHTFFFIYSQWFTQNSHCHQAFFIINTVFDAIRNSSSVGNRVFLFARDNTITSYPLYLPYSQLRAEISQLKNTFVKRRIPPPQCKTCILIYIKLIFMKRILYTSTYAIDCRHIIIICILSCENIELITLPFHVIKCIFDT